MSTITSRSALLGFAFSGLMMAVQPGFAQNTDAAEGTQLEGVGEGLAMGQVVEETRQPGDTYIRETIEDWSVRCVVAQEGETDRCQLYQLLSDQEGQAIAEFTLLKLPAGGQAVAASTVIVPLETSLQNQLTIQVDDNPGKRYAFAFCNTIGCYSRIGLTAEDVTAYQRGGEATLSIVPMAAPDIQIRVTLSLTGFTAAYEKLETIAAN